MEQYVIMIFRKVHFVYMRPLVFHRQWKMDIRSNMRAMYKLKAAAESAKHTLSTNQTASIHVESLHEGMDFQYTLSRCVFCVCVL